MELLAHVGDRQDLVRSSHRFGELVRLRALEPCAVVFSRGVRRGVGALFRICLLVRGWVSGVALGAILDHRSPPAVDPERSLPLPPAVEKR
jgi:hypothetical protein